jgi:hypothetical protein
MKPYPELEQALQKNPSYLEQALGSTVIQRALLENRPYFLRGEPLMLARRASLVTCDVWYSRNGVNRRFHSRPNAGPAWHRAREAVLAVRRHCNLTVDPDLIGPRMIGVPNRFDRSRIGSWKPSWEGRDTVKVLRDVGKAACALLQRGVLT